MHFWGCDLPNLSASHGGPSGLCWWPLLWTSLYPKMACASWQSQSSPWKEWRIFLSELPMESTLLFPIECHCVEICALHACQHNCTVFSVVCKPHVWYVWRTLVCDAWMAMRNEDCMLSSDEDPNLVALSAVFTAAPIQPHQGFRLNYSAGPPPNQPNQTAKSQLEICQNTTWGWENVPVRRPTWVWRIPPCSLTLWDVPSGAVQSLWWTFMCFFHFFGRRQDFVHPFPVVVYSYV